MSLLTIIWTNSRIKKGNTRKKAVRSDGKTIVMAKDITQNKKYVN